jgi:adenosylhomocysteinase
MTIQTAVLIETLVELAQKFVGLLVTSSRLKTMLLLQSLQGVPVLLGKAKLKKNMWCLEQQINVNGTPWDANMILDDGGDLTALVHEKYPALLKNSRHY